MAGYGTGKNKYPLEHFEGKSREEILAVTGVGRKTYAKIRRALFWRSVKRFFTSPFLAVAAGWKALKREWARSRPRRVPRKGKARSKQLGSRIIVWILAALAVLALLWFGLYFLVQLTSQPVTVPVQSAASSTPTPTLASVEVVATEEAPAAAQGLVHLLVEIFEMHPQFVQYGILRPLDNVEIIISANRNGEPLGGERRAVVESRSGIDVALWEGDVPSGYWVTIAPPDGCSIWGLDSNWDGWYLVPFEYVGTDYPVKFQIVCGPVEVGATPTVVRTSPPQETPTDPPETPEPSKTPEPPDTPVPTDPPPTEPPQPTPTEVTCSNCEDDPPQTPVPTPEPIEATATPSR